MIEPSVEQQLEDQDWVEASFASAMKVFGAEGWDDPSMDIYDQLDPRRRP